MINTIISPSPQIPAVPDISKTSSIFRKVAVAEAGGGVCDYWIDGAGGQLPPPLCWDYGALNVSCYGKLALAVLKKVYNKGFTVGLLNADIKSTLIFTHNFCWLHSSCS